MIMPRTYTAQQRAIYTPQKAASVKACVCASRVPIRAVKDQVGIFYSVFVDQLIGPVIYTWRQGLSERKCSVYAC